MFEVVWNCHNQNYTVFKDGRYLRTTYDGVAVRSYLNGGKIISCPRNENGKCEFSLYPLTGCKHKPLKAQRKTLSKKK